MVLPDLNNEDFHKLLKEKMDSFSTKAPDGLWNGISNELNQTVDDELNTENQLIDTKLREAASKSKIAPEFIWYGIEQKLNLDRVWNNMQPELNRIKRTYLFRKSISYISAAAILLLFLRSCSFDNMLQKPVFVEIENQNTSVNDNIQKNAELPSSEDEPNSNNSGKIDLANNNRNFKSQQKKNQLEGAFGTTKQIEININDIALKQINESIKQLTGNKETTNAGNNETINADKNESLNAGNSQTTNADKNEPSIIEMENREFKLNNEFVATPDVRDSHLKNKTKIEYRLGLITSIKSSLITNYDNSAKLNRLRAEDIQLMPNPSFSYGVQIIAKKSAHSFIAEFWYDYKEKQEYSYSLSGRRHSDIIEISYVRFNLLYRPILFSYGKTSVNAVAGAYLSNLKGSSLSSTMPNRNLDLSELNNWNPGILLGIGQEHKIGSSLVIDYGLRNEIGLNSIYKTKGNIHSKSNLMGFSAFVALAYRFQ